VPGFSDQYRTDDDEGARFSRWRASAYAGCAPPYRQIPASFGVGPGCSAGLTEGESGRSPQLQNTHSAYLQVSSESGVPALIFYLLFLLSIFDDSESVRRLSAVDSDSHSDMGRSLAFAFSGVGLFRDLRHVHVRHRVRLSFHPGGPALAAQRLLLQKAGAPRPTSARHRNLPHEPLAEPSGVHAARMSLHPVNACGPPGRTLARLASGVREGTVTRPPRADTTQLTARMTPAGLLSSTDADQGACVLGVILIPLTAPFPARVPFDWLTPLMLY